MTEPDAAVDDFTDGPTPDEMREAGWAVLREDVEDVLNLPRGGADPR